MHIVFICTDCNISFVKTELMSYIRSRQVQSLTIITDLAVESDEILSSAKVYVNILSEKSEFRKELTFSEKRHIAYVTLREVVYNPLKYLTMSSLKSMVFEVVNEFKKAGSIERFNIPQEAVWLSYWGSNDGMLLSLLARKGKARLPFSKLHAYDLYEEFAPKGRIPFRWFLLKHVQRFIAISEDGRNYFVKKYPRLAHRTDMFHLGTKDRNVAIQPAPADVIRVVTCGSATPNKRHMEVFQVLNQMQGVEWYHIGAGDLFDELREKVQKEAKIPVKLLGHLSQDEIYALYATTPFTCFLSLSVTAGLPVSMMEAISCGIPLVSTDVGGCREIAVPETGYLLSQQYTEAEVMERIRDCANGPLAGMEGRKDIYAFWKQNFEADTNYGKFLSYLKQFIRK